MVRAPSAVTRSGATGPVKKAAEVMLTPFTPATEETTGALASSETAKLPVTDPVLVHEVNGPSARDVASRFRSTSAWAGWAANPQSAARASLDRGISKPEQIRGRWRFMV